MRLFVFLLDATGNDTQLSLGLLGAYPGLESANQVGAVHEAPSQLLISRLVGPPQIADLMAN